MNRARMDRARITPATVLALICVLALTGCGSAHAAASPRTSTVPSAPATVAPSVTPLAPVPSPSPSASPTPTIPKKLTSGDKGAAVLLLQQRLTDLGYWLGKPDGKFGGSTQQAVYALQKAAGQSPTGTVTAATWSAIDKGVRPKPRTTSGSAIEVDLKHDLLLFVIDGKLKYTMNTSTGGGYAYYDQGHRYIATTPKGHFKTYRTINGPHRSSLGLLYRPRYFFEGDAIHGDSSVPAHPASHGCVRVTDAAINFIWSANLDPVGRTVWVY